MRSLFCAILFVISIAPHARADGGCAVLLASPPSSNRLSSDQALQAYFSDLLQETVLGIEELLAYKKNLEAGKILNPITDHVALMKDGAWVHQDSLQRHIDEGGLTVSAQLEWATAELARREYNERQREITEKDSEKIDAEVTRQEWWENARERSLKHIVDPNQVVEDKLVLQWAVKYAPYETFKKFVEMYRGELDLDARDSERGTGLIDTILANKDEKALFLIESGAGLNTGGLRGPFLHFAIKTGASLAVVKAIVARLKDEEGKFISRISNRGNGKKVRIGKSNNNINDPGDREGNRALHLAVVMEDIPLIEFLLDSGANIDDLQIDVDGVGMRRTNVEMQRLFTRRRIDRAGDRFHNLYGGAIHWAAKVGNIPIVDLLAKRGANLDIGDIANKTAVDWAIAEKNFQMFEALVARGASVTRRHFELALRQGNFPIVQFFVERGEDLFARGKDGRIPYLQTRDQRIKKFLKGKMIKERGRIQTLRAIWKLRVSAGVR